MMTFPCTISLKVFARGRDNLQSVVREIIVAEIAEENLFAIRARESSNGRYRSFSCRLRARDRATLDALFVRLSRHPQVLLVI